MMRAAVYHGAKDVRIEERPVPTVRHGYVLMRVLRSGICGTDASEYLHGPSLFPVDRRHPASGHQGPMIMGHEFTGEVVACGTGTEHLAGMRLATGAGVSCGACAWCRAGRTNLCASYWTLGLNADGGLAEYALVPASTCVPIPDECSDDAAGLAQPLAVGLHAARRAGAGPDDTVVLIGAGAIGSFILCGLTAGDGLGARRAGPGSPVSVEGLPGGVRPPRVPLPARPARVIALDVDDARLTTATALGATDVVNVRGRDPVEVVHDLTDREGA
jgi:(R,R)-butanediol dehydrogenase / meso-butanediol dehydrogenase / diacetyl reductase